MKKKIKLLASSSIAISIAILGSTSVFSMDDPQDRDDLQDRQFSRVSFNSTPNRPNLEKPLIQPNPLGNARILSMLAANLNDRSQLAPNICFSLCIRIDDSPYNANNSESCERNYIN